MSIKHFIFGYGSLVNVDSLRRTLNFPDSTIINYQYCCLKNHVRVWDVGMDNAKSISNRNYYVSKENNEISDVFITYLDIQEVKEKNIVGILFEVTEEGLSLFDTREIDYQRKEVTDMLDIAVDGIAWAYYGLTASKEAYENALSKNRAVISKSYNQLVRQAYDEISKSSLEEFDQSTHYPDIPQLDLQLIRKKS